MIANAAAADLHDPAADAVHADRLGHRPGRRSADLHVGGVRPGPATRRPSRHRRRPDLPLVQPRPPAAHLPRSRRSTSTPRLGEAVPMTNRNPAFRVTVRDNRRGAAGSTTGRPPRQQVRVTTAAGPFAVTPPNTAVTWAVGNQQAVTWNVAGTHAPPISCANVADHAVARRRRNLPDHAGGERAQHRYGHGRRAQTPTHPGCAFASPSGDIFFDVSNANFTIAAVGDPDPAGAIAGISPTSFTFTLDAGDTASDTLTVSNTGDASTTLTFSIFESSDGCASAGDVSWLGATWGSSTIAGGSSAPVTVNVDTAALAEGAYSGALRDDRRPAASAVRRPCRSHRQRDRRFDLRGRLRRRRVTARASLWLRTHPSNVTQPPAAGSSSVMRNAAASIGVSLSLKCFTRRKPEAGIRPRRHRRVRDPTRSARH